MKILVLSDTHHNIRLMNTIIDKEKPDMLIHLGDCLDDMENNPLIFALPCNSVPGNCDYDYPSEDKVFHLFKTTFFITHGHNYGVKYSTDILRNHAQMLGANIALFGHTHKQFLQTEAGLILMNPGSVGRPPQGHTSEYGIITVDNNGPVCTLSSLQ